jgi:magnesium transporter
MSMPQDRSTSLFRRHREVGALPGVLVADPSALAPTINVTMYGPESHQAIAACDVDRLASLRGEAEVIWVDVVGLGDVELIRRIGEIFGLHRLALEDVVHVGQRPKLEPYEEYLFIVARLMIGTRAHESEQVSFFLGDGFLITFQERPDTVWDRIRRRLAKDKVRIRHSGADFLAYTLLDCLIDSYYPVLEHYGEALEALEDELIANPKQAHVDRLHGLRREVLTMRRALWPTREMVNLLIRDDTGKITDGTRMFLRDCYDHTIQLMDTVESIREIAADLLDVYMSAVSARMNEVMKVLTVIATIFIPLGFIAGVYGMNFDPQRSPWNMPELEWTFGYPFVLGLMAAVAGGLLVFFWRRGWIGPGGAD